MKIGAITSVPRVLFESVAKEHFFVDTLEQRNMDRLDFHDVSVAGIVAAFSAIYNAGRMDGRNEHEEYINGDLTESEYYDSVEDLGSNAIEQEFNKQKSFGPKE